MVKGTCCCCFTNSVRHLVLLLSFFTLVSLFSNLVLFNLVVTYKDELLPDHFNTPLEGTGLRLKRFTNLTNAILSDGVPVTQDELGSHSLPDFATEALISEIKKEDDLVEHDFGHPIASDETPTTTTTFRPTVKTSPKVVILTRATTPGETTIKLDFPKTLAQTTEMSDVRSNKSEEQVSLYTKKLLSESQDKDVKEISGKKKQDDAGKTADTGGQKDDTEVRPVRDWLKDLEQCSIFVTPGLGILFGHFPMTYTIHQIGAYRLMAISLAVSAIVTAVMPFFYELGFYAIASLRFMHGLSFAISFAFIGVNAAKWGALKEQLTFVTFLASAFPMAILFSWTTSNYLLQQNHFIAVYVLHAGITLILLIAWLVFYRNTPQKHRWVNGLELNKIMTGKVQKNRLIENKPIVSLMKSVSAWAIWTASFGYFFAFSALTLFLPLYVRNVLGTTIDSMGTLITLPFITMLFLHYLSFFLNKCLSCCSLTIKIRIFNTIAFVGTAISFIVLAALFPEPAESLIEWSLWIFVFAILPLGFAANGFYQSSVVVGRYYSQFIVSHLQVPFGLAMTVVPMILFFVTPENNIKYWKIFFIIVAAVLILTSIIFCVLGQGTPASWAERSWDPQATSKMLDHIDPVGRGAECGVIEMRTIDEYLNENKIRGSSFT